MATITGDATGETQSLLQLSGAQSGDADGDPLNYQWSILSTPTSANAVLGTPTQVQTTFAGDTAGVYVIGLIVHDGDASSRIVPRRCDAISSSARINAVAAPTPCAPGSM